MSTDEQVEDLISSVSGEFVGAARGTDSNAFERTKRSTLKRAPLGFGTYSIAAAASAILTARPQRAFHADRLLVTSSQLGVTVSSIKIGDEEQVLGGAVPAELYGVNALADSKPDDFSPIPSGIDASITLTNNAATTSTGAVGMKGSVKR
jgi:hypothetical protein